MQKRSPLLGMAHRSKQQQDQCVDMVLLTSVTHDAQQYLWHEGLAILSLPSWHGWS